jgi:hypothetical protein
LAQRLSTQAVVAVLLDEPDDEDEDEGDDGDEDDAWACGVLLARRALREDLVDGA